jgi:hypothetical protein
VSDLSRLKAMGLNYPVEWEFESSTGEEAGNVHTDAKVRTHKGPTGVNEITVRYHPVYARSMLRIIVM